MTPTLFEVGDIVRTFVQVDELHRVCIVDREAIARVCHHLVQTSRLKSSTH
jgi:hypothetical protein